MKAALVEDADGQNLLPNDFAGTILLELSRQGVIRSQATVRPTNRRVVDLGAIHVGSASWGKLELGDTAADGLGTPPATKDTVTVHDLNALVKISRDEMEDSDTSLVELIREAVVAKLAEQEDDAFASGTGDANKQPLGIAAATSGITQGITAAAPGTLAVDDLVRLPFAVPGWARNNAAYYAHSSLTEVVSLLKDTDATCGSPRPKPASPPPSAASPGTASTDCPPSPPTRPPASAASSAT